MSTKIRELGFAEARMHALHSLFAGTTQSVAALRIVGPCNVELLDEAVRVLEARHELLRVRIESSESSYYFAAIAEQKSRLCVHERAACWRDVFEECVSAPLRGPLWEVHVIPSGEEWDLFFVTHHSISDGHSMERTLAQLLRIYATLLEGARPEMVAMRRVPPSAETMLRSRLDWSDFVTVQRKLSDLKPPDVEPHRGAAPVDERRTKTVFFRIASLEATRLEARAEELGFTFNSLVAASLLKAVKTQSPFRRRISMSTAFSLRPLCDQLEQDDLGCYVSVIPTYHEPDGSELVEDLARSHLADLRRATLRHARHPMNVERQGLEASMRPLLAASTFVHDVGYTYAGTKLDKSYGPLAVEHFFASANRSLGTACVVLHGVKHQGAVYFTLNYTAPLQTGEWARATAACLEELLLAAQSAT